MLINSNDKNIFLKNDKFKKYEKIIHRVTFLNLKSYHKKIIKIMEIKYPFLITPSKGLKSPRKKQ